MFTKSNCIFALIAMSLAASGYAQRDVKSAMDSKPARTPIEGMKAYYEPENVKKSGDNVVFKMYSSPSSVADGEEYSLNCSTHEIASREGPAKSRGQPSPVLAGESMYPIAKKLCGWGPGFWQKLMD